ncbi:bcl-2-like protein 2 isoform X3 [Patiria miniata]|uniref:Bcl-2 Bcl-2 homology region 1-3 domain-containing protein n=1 Tax=Patiria miniata TaxID=46514 RepID=A0A913YZ06_PATMI|nr:bcl-2-like protein 2 isoform X3 [Patiria miniata]
MPDLTTESVVADYLRYKLNSEGLQCPFTEAPERSDPPTPFQNALRRETRKIEVQYQRNMNGEAITDSFHLTPTNASSTFHSTVHVLFHSGQNAQGTGNSVQASAGRICSLLAFSGVFVVHCVRNEMPQLVEQVAQWTIDYINANLLAWINQNGGWIGLFQPPAVPQDPWMPRYGIMLGVAALGAVTALAMKLARLKGLF